MDHTQNSNTREVQFSSVIQSCPTLCDPMDCSTPGLPVHHQLPEFTQTHVHCVSDAIQPSHPLSSPSPPTFNLSQNQGLFKWVSSSHQVAKVLEFQLQHQSFQFSSWFCFSKKIIIHYPWSSSHSGVPWCIWEGRSAHLRDRVWERWCLLSGWMLTAFAGKGFTLFAKLVLQVL